MPNPKDTPNADINPSDILQGHNCQVQKFTLRRQQVVQDRKKKRACREFVFQDQFDNWYLVYRAKLQDGEEYDVGDWVKPSVLQKFGGFTDECLDAFRMKAFYAFEDMTKEIAKLRTIASEVAGKNLADIPANLGLN